MAFGFYQLACMLLAIYEPTSRFAVRSSRQVLPETDVGRFNICPCYQTSTLTVKKIVMRHARALCGACKGAPSTVPSFITLCHSTFICTCQQVRWLWNSPANKLIGAPLMTDSSERRCIIRMLNDLEKLHAWPTAWIIKALQEEWEI